MKPNKVSIAILTILNCPACDKLKIIVNDLLANNKFLKQHVTGVEFFPCTKYDEEYTEFPVFQIYSESGKLLYEAAGCYSQATVMWKLIKWIVPNGK